MEELNRWNEFEREFPNLKLFSNWHTKKKQGTRAGSIDHAALFAHPRALELEIDHERRGVSVRMHRDPMGSIFFGTRLKLETSSSFTPLKPNMLVPEMKSFLNIRWRRINY